MTGVDHLDIAVRAFTEKPNSKPLGAKQTDHSFDKPSSKVLIFDCETTVDAGQSLRIGFFQIRDEGLLECEGVFYEEDALSPEEIATLRNFAARHGLSLITAREFRRDVFLRVAYDEGGQVIGFNLPFDISRIAIGHGIARGSMRGGFSFRLSKDRRTPSVRVKHLSRNAALIDFAVPGLQVTPRSMRSRELRTYRYRGFFADVKTLAAALTQQKGSLASLCDFLATATSKLETDEHGGPITEAYLTYARTDVQATWECYVELERRYHAHGLSKPLHRVLSEASIGKAYLEDMGVSPLLAKQPDFPRGLFGQIVSAYYGGRAEVRIRREIRRVLYCDFKSMYPTVNALMRLWPFVTANEITVRDATEETRAFFDAITLADLQASEIWRQLAVIVKVKPDGDLFPVRAKYDDRSYTIGLNYLRSEQPLYYTLADCIVAKLLSGKTPAIIEALRFEPRGVQEGLKPINLFGNPAYRVDPESDDVFSRFVDLRDEAKASRDPIEQAIKIIANATSYGIFIEVHRDDAPKPEPLNIYGLDGKLRATRSKALEQPGRYFNPLLGVLITGAARLMLALAERLTLDAGLEWVFCDTDSLAIAKPEGVNEKSFLIRTQSIIDWFTPLNPYRRPGSILKIEDANYDIERGKTLSRLYAYSISAKRYALFNVDAHGGPVIRKASAHGLGHLLPPYAEKDAPKNVPAPRLALSKIGIARWQHDLWFKIIEAALSGHPNQVDFDYHATLENPALSRYGATSPEMLSWFNDWNSRRAYAAQVKPFGFLTAFQGRNGSNSSFKTEEVEGAPEPGRPHSRPCVSPVAPFEREPDKAARLAFDRVTGQAVSVEGLRTYSEAVAPYPLSPEAKFRNGGPADSGITERRRVHASALKLIGKEGNRVELEGLQNLADQLFAIGDAGISHSYSSVPTDEAPPKAS